MKHARIDYDRIQDPLSIIPEDEPVFLLRGQDVLAPAIVRQWATNLILRGGSHELAQKARDQAEAMEAWQVSVRSKVPDFPPEVDRLIEELREMLDNHSDIEARPVIQEFITRNQSALVGIPNEWFYKNR